MADTLVSLTLINIWLNITHVNHLTRSFRAVVILTIVNLMSVNFVGERFRVNFMIVKLHDC